MHKIDEVQCSLQRASEDEDNKVYMVQSQLQVCCFDKVKEWYVSERIPLANPTPKSNDALYFDKDECFFIEFKNGRITSEVNFEFILFGLDQFENYLFKMCIHLRRKNFSRNLLM